MQSDLPIWAEEIKAAYWACIDVRKRSFPDLNVVDNGMQEPQECKIHFRLRILANGYLNTFLDQTQGDLPEIIPINRNITSTPIVEISEDSFAIGHTEPGLRSRFFLPNQRLIY